MNLLVDIGNSRIKWAWLDGVRLGPYQALSHKEFSAGEAYEEWRGKGPPEKILAANVAGPLLAENLVTITENLWDRKPEFAKSTQQAGGVVNGYKQAESLGIDRWLCLIGARAAHAGSLCIADIGTAITIDFLAADGRHQGGIIAPGPHLMRTALVRGTRDLGNSIDDEPPDVTLFARDTQAAMYAGSVHSAAALVDHAMTQAENQLSQPVIGVLTGGDAERIRPLLKATWHGHADLVLQGLAVIIQEQACDI